jgi:hypothetical protein
MSCQPVRKTTVTRPVTRTAQRYPAVGSQDCPVAQPREEAEFEALEEALAKHGKPDIFNTD